MLKKAGLILFTICLVTFGILAFNGYRQLFLPLPLNTTLEYHLAPGTSLKSLAKQLEKENIIDCSFCFEWYARLTGLDAKLQAGEYAIHPDHSAVDIFNMMQCGEVHQHSFTIVEGWTFYQLRENLHNVDALDQDIDPNLSDADVMRRLGHSEQYPEGWFYPDTYHFPRGTTVSQFLQRAYNTMQTALDKQWQQRSEGLPLKSSYDALILASIVEKETAVVEERPLIAAVFINRLRKRMRLQTDPTVIYGLGNRYDGDIRFRDLKKDTPYNTYTRGGLPPTPIAMPSEDAIHSVLHPAQSNALYFVAKGDGSHHFSVTLSEHNDAVDKFQRKRRPL
ncbi:MAG: endolytic transglycosylase MltG [Gammaproteobacteria bacterium]|nr:endolytic transglycosylase MltG [Gammaproteobacteria bacterium]